MEHDRERVTKLLQAIEGGEARAAVDLLPLVYDELRARAGALMAGERRDHTLQRTALVHESYLKLVGSGAGFRSRLHFFDYSGVVNLNDFNLLAARFGNVLAPAARGGIFDTKEEVPDELAGLLG